MPQTWTDQIAVMECRDDVFGLIDLALELGGFEQRSETASGKFEALSHAIERVVQRVELPIPIREQVCDFAAMAIWGAYSQDEARRRLRAIAEHYKALSQ